MTKPTRYKSAMWGRAIPRNAKWKKRTLLAVCAAILSAGMAFADSSKMSSDLMGKDGSGQVDVIVQFKDVPTAQDHEKVFSRGGVLKTDLGRFRGGAYRVPVSTLSELAADPGVVYISPDRPLKGAATSIQLDYHNETINSSAAWSQNLTGAGIGIAVIDSGIDAAVPDLNSTVVYNQDFTGIGSATDQYGHGTHVAGIIAGNGARSSIWNADYTFLGVAQDANLVNLRVLDQNGAGTDSEVIAAIQQAIALKSAYNIRVINLSLGRPVYESYKLDPLCQAVEQAWNAGIVVVVAAGNDGRDNSFGTYGYGTIAAPGNDPYVITVGAMNTLNSSNRAIDVPASYSSKGPTILDHIVKPDLVAPGNLIISLYFGSATLNQESPSNEVPKNLFLWTDNSGTSGYYFTLSGTSMATPMVSAAAAIELQQTPTLTPDQVKARLMQSAFKNLVQYSTAPIRRRASPTTNRPISLPWAPACWTSKTH